MIARFGVTYATLCDDASRRNAGTPPFASLFSRIPIESHRANIKKFGGCTYSCIYTYICTYLYPLRRCDILYLRIVRRSADSLFNIRHYVQFKSSVPTPQVTVAICLES
ncbi:hypothetical protein ACS0PU_004276 [Formica fusca]